LLAGFTDTAPIELRSLSRKKDEYEAIKVIVVP
jgi:hypothetical protein